MQERILIFDIRSSSVGAALFVTNKKGVPLVLSSLREDLHIKGEINAENILTSSVKALEQCAHKISMSNVGKIDKIFCTLSSPWYASQTRLIKFEKNSPFIFTSKMAKGLLDKETGIFKKEISETFSNQEEDIKILESKNLQISLNGYPMLEPFNKRTKTVEMSVFMSLSGEGVLAKFKDAIFKSFHTREVEFITFSIALFTLARDLFDEYKDFALVDVSGEMTDVSIIRKETFEESVSFPVGTHHVFRQIQKDLQINDKDTKSFFSTYKAGHYSTSMEKKIAPIIKKAENSWLSGFEEVLLKLSKGVHFPSDIFLITEEGMYDFFADLIKKEHFHQYNLSESKFKVNFLDSKNLHGVLSFSENTKRDPFLSIEAVYINRFIC